MLVCHTPMSAYASIGVLYEMIVLELHILADICKFFT